MIMMMILVILLLLSLYTSNNDIHLKIATCLDYSTHRRRLADYIYMSLMHLSKFVKHGKNITLYNK